MYNQGYKKDSFQSQDSPEDFSQQVLISQTSHEDRDQDLYGNNLKEKCYFHHLVTQNELPSGKRGRRKII